MIPSDANAVELAHLVLVLVLGTVEYEYEYEHEARGRLHRAVVALSEGLWN
jgi:hypothetical protein